MKQTDNLEGIKSKASVNLLGGLLSSNLKSYKLGDVAEIIISSVDKKTKVGEQKVRLCNFVDVYHNWAITQSMHESFMIASAKEKDIERLSLKQGYVALTKDSETRDDIGISTYIADNFDSVILGYHCALVKPNEDILLGKYLNAFLHSNYIKKYFELNATGSGMRYTLSAQTLYDIPILLPSLEEQEYIGNVFSTIDRKIALNRSINHNLEAMAKQLYDYWFVQFDFPDENGKPYKSSGGKMVWNEKLKREIPEGWTCCNLSEIEPNIVTGKTPSTNDDSNFGGDIPFITIDDLRRTQYVFYTTRTLSEKGAYSQLKKFLPVGSLCCSCIGTVGILGFVGKRGQTNQQLNTVVFENEYNKEYIYFSLGLYFRYASAKVGNILPNMSKDDFSKILLLYPTKNLVMEYHKKVKNLFNQIECIIANIESLTKQRDSLLPLLMNGQVSLNYDLSND